MTLPEGFNEFEFLQDLVRKWQNRIVREEFEDLGGADWDPDITVSRGAVRHACTHKDTDTAEMDIMRLFLYYFVYRKAQDLQPPIYGMPKGSFDAEVSYRPQVVLYFYQKSHEVEGDNDAVRGEISFRLMHETSQSLTYAELRRYASRIKSIFAVGTGLQWRKGKYKYTYLDKSKGYDFRILAISEAEAKDLIIKTLDIQEHSPQWEYFTAHNPDNPAEAYPENPGVTDILAKPRKKPRRRPNATVYFRWASISIHGLANDIVLVDMAGVKTNALIEV